jgi:phosphohistidine phosphatase
MLGGGLAVELYLIRHADALPLGEGGVMEDADRPLSETGNAQVKSLAESLQRHDIHPGILATSPLLRARQTAEELVKHWTGSAPTVQECAELAIGGKTRKLARFLRELEGNSIGVVGHQPDLCECAAWLIGSRKAQLDLAKAGVACISCPDGPEKGAGTLLWLVTPTWFGVR